MRKYLLSLIFISVLLALGCIYFLNNLKLKFSIEPGFYSNEINLELIGGNGFDIFYTLDGSVPDRNSTPYEGSILLKNASQNENIYSAREDVSTGFFLDLISEFSNRTPPQLQYS